MQQVTTDLPLRMLLQTARRAHGMTQREAAQRAGIDSSWWKKLESGRRTQTQAGTVAAMAYAVEANPEELERLGWTEVADRLRILLTRDILPEVKTDSAEEHLARTPETTAQEREELIIRLRELRSLRSGIRTVVNRTAHDEPFEKKFLSDQRYQPQREGRKKNSNARAES